MMSSNIYCAWHRVYESYGWECEANAVAFPFVIYDCGCTGECIFYHVPSLSVPAWVCSYVCVIWYVCALHAFITIYLSDKTVAFIFHTLRHLILLDSFERTDKYPCLATESLILLEWLLCCYYSWCKVYGILRIYWICNQTAANTATPKWQNHNKLLDDYSLKQRAYAVHNHFFLSMHWEFCTAMECFVNSTVFFFQQYEIECAISTWYTNTTVLAWMSAKDFD